MAELEKMGEIEGLVTTRAQERQEIVQEAGKGNKDKSEAVTEKEEGKTEETRQPAYCREPRIANSEVLRQVLQQILEVEVSKVRVWDLLVLSGELRREMVEQTCTQNKLPVVRDTLVTVPEAPVEFATPLKEVEVMVIGRHREMGLLDEGSEIMIIRGDLCDELGVEVNMKRKMTMQTENGGKEEMQGCVEYLKLKVGGVKTYTHAFVVQLVPYQLLLGRPWQKGVKLGKIERADGSVEVEISDPKEEMR